MNKILDHIEESLVCVCLVVMTALTFVNVVARYVFSASLSFSEEITTYLFVLLSLLGSAIAAKRGAHLGLTIISDRVGPKAGRVLGIISMAFATVFSAIICYFGFFHGPQPVQQGSAHRRHPAARVDFRLFRAHRRTVRDHPLWSEPGPAAHRQGHPA